MADAAVADEGSILTLEDETYVLATGEGYVVSETRINDGDVETFMQTVQLRLGAHPANAARALEWINPHAELVDVDATDNYLFIEFQVSL